MELTIIDLDGCISDDRWRRHFIDRTKSDGWNHYHNLCKLDSAINLDIALPHLQAGYAICTGRPDAWRMETLRWFERNNLPATPHVMMRTMGDFRSSVLLKRDMLKQLRYFGHTITHAFDDRLDICDMYVAEGVPHVHRLTARRKHREIPTRVS